MKKLLLILFLTSQAFGQFEPFDFFNPPYQKETIAHIKRVVADGGAVYDKDGLDRMISAMKFDKSYTSAKILCDPNWGVKVDGSGYVSKLYNVVYKLGSNLTVNGTFDADANWTKGTGCTISNGVVTLSGSSSSLEQVLAGLVNGKQYKLAYKVVSSTLTGNLSASSVGFGGVTQTLPKTIGINTTNIICQYSNYALRLVTVSGETGAITLDNITVQEVLNPDLEQSTAANQPKLIVYKDNSGANTQRRTLLFDGSNDYLKTASMTLNQPEVVYMGVRQVSWTINEYLFDGYTTASALGYQRTSSPTLAINAGNPLATSDLAVGNMGLFKGAFNGANSLIQINNFNAVTGNAGVNNAGGFALGSTAGGTSNSNIESGTILILNAIPTATQDQRIKDRLMARWEL